MKLKTFTAAWLWGIYAFHDLLFKVLSRERFVFVYFTMGLSTWAPGQGVQGEKKGGRQGKRAMEWVGEGGMGGAGGWGGE